MPFEQQPPHFATHQAQVVEQTLKPTTVVLIPADNPEKSAGLCPNGRVGVLG
jgi:hypothetical protein